MNRPISRMKNSGQTEWTTEASAGPTSRVDQDRTVKFRKDMKASQKDNRPSDRKPSRDRPGSGARRPDAHSTRMPPAQPPIR